MTFRCRIIDKKEQHWSSGPTWDCCTVTGLIQEIENQFYRDKHEIEIIAIGDSVYAYFPSEDSIIRWDRISNDE